MTRKQNMEAAGWHAERASEIAEFLALPAHYFNPHGAQHWYQVVSRSEIEARLDMHHRMITHYETLAA